MASSSEKEYLANQRIPHLVEDIVAELLRSRPTNPRKFIRDLLDAELKAVTGGDSSKEQDVKELEEQLDKGIYREVALARTNNWATDNSYSIGRTPLVKLTRTVPAEICATVLVKVEGRNPAYSVKCRVGASMIWDAEKRGILKPGMTIVEPTSGNTGIGLAYVAACRGYQTMIVLPETMSIERRKVMKAFGTKLVLTEAAKGMKGAIARAEEILASDPSKYYMPQQFKNPANPLIHELTTGPEIWEATEGKVDAVVCGVGTGGTITGIGRFLKRKNPAVQMIAVEPAQSPVMTQAKAGHPLKGSPHRIQGIGPGFIPEVLDMKMVDEIVCVDDSDAIVMTRRLGSEDGILSGISSGAAVVAAFKLATDKRYAGKVIVALLPDAGERYLTSVLFDSPEFRALESAGASSGIL